MTDALHDLPVAEAGRRLREGSLTSSALTEAALERIAALDARLDSFIRVTPDRARADAQAADAAFRAGHDAGPMQGIPYGLKDIYDTAGIPSTCHSRLRVDNIPAQDSVVAGRLRAGGGVLLGKLATHEFALGGPSHDLPFPPARNPWNTEHIPGGSSSGSGAAVAAGLTRMAMGSDTGGSIRGPANYCGTVGLKPTYGLVSRRGVFPLSTTLDHCGPLAWSVEDAAICMEVIAGHDPLDPASADVPVPAFRADLHRGVEGLRVGVPRTLFARADGVSPEVLAGIERALDALRAGGAVVQDVPLPDYEQFNVCGRVIMLTEAFAIHEQDFRSRPLDFGRLTYMRMTLGAFVTAADLLQAFRLRRELARAVNAALVAHDVLVTACALAPAPAFSEINPDGLSNWPIQSIPFNVTGNPALCVPTGLSGSGLPIGLQVVGRAFDEPMVLRVGAMLEREAGLGGRRPGMA